MTTKKKRRRRGTGSVYQELDYWVGCIDVDSPTGKRTRRRVYAPTEAAAEAKLAALRAEADLLANGMQSEGVGTLHALLEAALVITARLRHQEAAVHDLANRMLILLDRPEPDVALAVATARLALERRSSRPGLTEAPHAGAAPPTEDTGH